MLPSFLGFVVVDVVVFVGDRKDADGQAVAVDDKHSRASRSARRRLERVKERTCSTTYMYEYLVSPWSSAPSRRGRGSCLGLRTGVSPHFSTNSMREILALGGVYERGRRAALPLPDPIATRPPDANVKMAAAAQALLRAPSDPTVH